MFSRSVLRHRVNDKPVLNYDDDHSALIDRSCRTDSKDPTSVKAARYLYERDEEDETARSKECPAGYLPTPIWYEVVIELD